MAQLGFLSKSKPLEGIARSTSIDRYSTAMHPAPHFTQDRHIEWFTSMTGGLNFEKKVGFYVFFYGQPLP